MRPLVSALMMGSDRPSDRAASGSRFAPNNSTRTTTKMAMCHGLRAPSRHLQSVGSGVRGPSYVGNPVTLPTDPRGFCSRPEVLDDGAGTTHATAEAVIWKDYRRW